MPGSHRSPPTSVIPIYFPRAFSRSPRSLCLPFPSSYVSHLRFSCTLETKRHKGVLNSHSRVFPTARTYSKPYICLQRRNTNKSAVTQIPQISNQTLRQLSDWLFEPGATYYTLPPYNRSFSCEIPTTQCLPEPHFVLAGPLRLSSPPLAHLVLAWFPLRPALSRSLPSA